MYIFVRYLGVFCVFCLIFHDFGGLDGLSEGVVGRENSENLRFGGVGLAVELGALRERVKKVRGVFMVKN